MSDATTVYAPLPVAPNAAAGVVAHSNVDAPLQHPSVDVTTDATQLKQKRTEEFIDTSISYSLDRDAGTLRLKVTNSQGDTIRVLTFTDFVSTMKTSSLAKGVLVDDRS